VLGGRSGQCKVKIAVLSQFTDCWTKFHMICWKSATGITFHSHSSIPIPVHSFPQSHSYSYYHDIVIVSLIAIGPMGSQLFPFPTTSLPYFYLLPFQFVRLGSCESLRYTILRYLSPSSVLYVVMRVSGLVTNTCVPCKTCTQSTAFSRHVSWKADISFSRRQTSGDGEVWTGKARCGKWRRQWR